MYINIFLNQFVEKKRRKIVRSVRDDDSYPLSPVDMVLRSRFGFTSFRPGQRCVYVYIRAYILTYVYIYIHIYIYIYMHIYIYEYIHACTYKFLIRNLKMYVFLCIWMSLVQIITSSTNRNFCINFIMSKIRDIYIFVRF
jgi:hypothetical protein